MNTAAIATIARREIREMLNDWRIMVPIFLLSFILPLMLVSASSRVIRFVEDPNLADRLVPFAILVVGFIPSSFSLITALESFVGERERNSLESLLSMPISDNELYIGKLFSSLITPLLSSYIAMLIFTFLIHTIDPTLYFGAITVSRLVFIFLTVGLMAIAMVSGAVVISTHISSIRAANLMSSFILVPMALIVQMDAILMINDYWDVLWISVTAMIVLAILLIRFGMTTFNREEILSREHQRARDVKFLQIFRFFQTKRPIPAQSKQTHPILSIARRELYDTLTDWRVLAPSFVLTFIIPFALVGGTTFAVNFIGQPQLIARLVPFAILLVGFIPASFSLIVALDSFVGERERNSLEALLAMPITDNQLYISKLSSSIISPMITSWCSMIVFAFGLMQFHPQLYFVAMTPLVWTQLIVMITIITVLMVAGAVIISSHTSTIRAANLLASFVLLPMAVTIQLQALLIISRRWDVLWHIILILIVMTIALIRTGMKTFQREEILSREHDTFDIHAIVKSFGLFFREYQPAGVSPDHYQGLSLSAKRFYAKELPSFLKELRYPLVIAILCAIGGILVGRYIADDFKFIGNVQEGIDRYIAQIGSNLPHPSLGLAIIIFINNLRVSLLSNLFSALGFGIFACMVPTVAFTQVSFIASKLSLSGGSWVALGAGSPLQFLLGYVLPHGIVELPTFILSAALGIRIGASLMSPPDGFSVGQSLIWSIANFLKMWVFMLLPLILLAALIEGFVSPLVIHALYHP